MSYKTFKISGLFIALAGLLTLVYAIVSGLVLQVFYSLTRVHSDYWMVGFLLIPLLLIFLGKYYFLMGRRQKETNKATSVSCLLILIASILGILAYAAEMIFAFMHVATWGFIMLLTGIPIIILIVFGIVFLLVGFSKQKYILPR